MAILEGIRKKTGLLLVFVAGALLLFLVQGFAEDLLKFTGADESIYKGQIGDERIKNDLFEAKSQQKEQLARYNYAQSGQEFPEYLVNRIESEVWNELVEVVQNILEWEEMGNTFADFIHDQYVSIINNKRKEVK